MTYPTTTAPDPQLATANPSAKPASQDPQAVQAAAHGLPAANKAAAPATADALAQLWADLDAHARLRQAHEATSAMQSRQRFD